MRSALFETLLTNAEKEVSTGRIAEYADSKPQCIARAENFSLWCSIEPDHYDYSGDYETEEKPGTWDYVGAIVTLKAGTESIELGSESLWGIQIPGLKHETPFCKELWNSCYQHINECLKDLMIELLHPAEIYSELLAKAEEAHKLAAAIYKA